MEKEMLSKIRKISAATQNTSRVSVETLCETAKEFARQTDTNVAVINKNGKVILFYSPLNEKPLFTVKNIEKDTFVEQTLTEQLFSAHGSKENTGLSGYYLKNVKASELKKYKTVISPVIVSKEKTAVLFSYKETEFTEIDIALIEFVTAIAALIVSETEREVTTEQERKKTIVKAAVNSLSFSELEAIVHVFKELNSLEGLLVASKIADRVGITRSVIVNALRKFESAGVIESRSLGMKGTYIKVVNEYLPEELSKI